MCSFCCCCDHFLILPVFSLSHRPYHTPLNMSVEISWHCLVLDRSPSMVCCLSTRVIHWNVKLLLVWGFPPFIPCLKTSGILLTLKSSDTDLQVSSGERPDPPWSTSLGSRQELPVCPLQPFAAVPRGPLGSGRANYTLMTSCTRRKCSCGNTGYISYETSKAGHACSSCLAVFNQLFKKPEQLPRTIPLSLCQDHKGLFKKHSKVTT